MTKLRKLYEFVFELANFEGYLYSKFEKGLSLEIREDVHQWNLELQRDGTVSSESQKFGR